MLLSGKTAVVTGAGNVEGIGFAASKAFVDAGARVLLVDINEDEVAAGATLLGEQASYARADVRSYAEVAEVFAQARSQFGALDILLNNAGITQPRKIEQITREDYNAVIDVNLRGTLIATQQALPLMQAGSSIICIASIAAQRGGGLMGGAHYAASKGGVASFVKAVLIEAYFTCLKWFVVLCFAGMVVLVFGNVVLRYFFDSGITESEEFSRWLFVWSVFSGSVLVLRENGHLGVEFVVNNLPRPVRIVALSLSHALMLYATWLIVAGSWVQVRLNLNTYAPATGLSQSLFYGIGLVFGVWAGAILLTRLVLVLTGRMDRLESFGEEQVALEKAGVH